MICQQIDREVDAAALFAHLTRRGTQPGSILLESADTTHSERSFGVYRPSIRIQGKESQFEIEALDRRGQALLPMMLDHLPPSIRITGESPTRVTGEIEAGSSPASFRERLQTPSAADLLRLVLARCRVDQEEHPTPVGLYGVFAYDFVRQFESISKPKADVLGELDYVFYLSTRLFVTDHLRKQTLLISVIPDDEAFISEAEQDLAEMRQAFQGVPQRGAVTIGDFSSDTSREEYCRNVRAIKEDIAAGRVFQVVYGRMLEARFAGDAFSIYESLKRCNPSPYMFFMRDDRGVLVGASPELALHVSTSGSERQVVIKPIAGTKPRGLVGNHLDADLDERMGVALRIDSKELAEHTMLIDLARNDIAGISKPGTIRLHQAFAVEQFSHVQHLVSEVRGTLLDDLDAIHAYMATMNMGTLTGAPKPEAMQMISEFEHSSRGFFGGSVGFMTTRGEMEVAVIIRSMRIKEGRVYIRTGAGVVADSIPEHEWLETENKAQACIQALMEAQCVHA